MFFFACTNSLLVRHNASLDGPMGWLGWTHGGRASSEFQTSEFRFEERVSQHSQPFYMGPPIGNHDGWTHGDRAITNVPHGSPMGAEEPIHGAPSMAGPDGQLVEVVVGNPREVQR